MGNGSGRSTRGVTASRIASAIGRQRNRSGGTAARLNRAAQSASRTVRARRARGLTASGRNRARPRVR